MLGKEGLAKKWWAISSKHARPSYKTPLEESVSYNFQFNFWLFLIPFQTEDVSDRWSAFVKHHLCPKSDVHAHNTDRTPLAKYKCCKAVFVYHGRPAATKSRAHHVVALRVCLCCCPSCQTGPALSCQSYIIGLPGILTLSVYHLVPGNCLLQLPTLFLLCSPRGKKRLQATQAANKGRN